MKNNKVLAGHLAAFITILIWGTTFVSTKVLLDSFSPIEILLIRFLTGYLILWLVYPHKLTLTDKKQEWYFAAAGLCGITLYYLFENIALTFSKASNVGVIVSVSPFFTAVFHHLFFHGKRPGFRFLGSFFIAMAGICLISFQSRTAVEFNPLGDILAFAAAIIWACYSVLTKKISVFGYKTIQVTRHTFFYGLIFMLPSLFLSDFQVNIAEFTDLKNLLNFLFLGIGASALCFVTWNFAVSLLGSVKTSVYIYLVPVITAVFSAFFLQEKITACTICGILLVLFGLVLSEGKKTESGKI